VIFSLHDCGDDERQIKKAHSEVTRSNINHFTIVQAFALHHCSKGDQSNLLAV
jgi:hypothetical protein